MRSVYELRNYGWQENWIRFWPILLLLLWFLIFTVNERRRNRKLWTNGILTIFLFSTTVLGFPCSRIAKRLTLSTAWNWRSFDCIVNVKLKLTISLIFKTWLTAWHVGFSFFIYRTHQIFLGFYQIVIRLCWNDFYILAVAYCFYFNVSLAIHDDILVPSELSRNLNEYEALHEYDNRVHCICKQKHYIRNAIFVKEDIRDKTNNSTNKIQQYCHYVDNHSFWVEICSFKLFFNLK